MRYGTASTSASRKADAARHVGVLGQLHEDELGGPIDGHEQIELAFGGAYLGDIEMEEADGIAVELLSRRPIASHFRQTAHAMPLQASVQRRAGELRHRRLQGIQAVVKREQRVLAEGNDHGLLLQRKHR
jgi:hypothetical protein